MQIAKALGHHLLVLTLPAFAPALAAQAPTAAKLAPYKPTTGISGTLKSIGSDTMNNEMSLWAEGFRRFYPAVKIEIEGKGSATAPPALIAGTAQLGPMSRPMKDEEIAQFKAKHGFEPTAVRTSVDVLTVFVHRDNPLKELTLQQVDAIFSSTRKGGAAKEALTWGDLGLTGTWAAKPIQLYGRNSASGTYGYFKEHALFKGDFRATVKEQSGSGAVVQAVANDKYGIGYSGFGYLTPGAKALALAKGGGKAIAPSVESVYDESYPLARFLLVYINRSPSTALDPLRQEFVRYVLSREGQDAVVKNGYIPLTTEVIRSELNKLKL